MLKYSFTLLIRLKKKFIYFLDLFYINWYISSIYFCWFWGFWLTVNKNTRFCLVEHFNVKLDPKKVLLYINVNQQKDLWNLTPYVVSTFWGLLLEQLLDQCIVAWRGSSCSSAEMLRKAQVVFIVLSTCLYCWIWNLIFILNIFHRSSVEFRSGEFVAQSDEAHWYHRWLWKLHIGTESDRILRLFLFHQTLGMCF